MEKTKIEALSRGDHKAFEDFFIIYFRRVKIFISGIIKSDVDAEELAQDVFVKLSNDFASEELENQIKKTPSTLCHIILEKSDRNQVIDTDWKFLTLYSGYWQSELYFKDIEPRIREAFHFDTTKLNKNHWLSPIQFNPN